MISDIGVPAAYIFSVGALVFPIIYRIVEAVKQKYSTGKFWNVQDSNLFYKKQIIV
jgi:hypothetical protein